MRRLPLTAALIGISLGAHYSPVVTADPPTPHHGNPPAPPTMHTSQDVIGAILNMMALEEAEKRMLIGITEHSAQNAPCEGRRLFKFPIMEEGGCHSGSFVYMEVQEALERNGQAQVWLMDCLSTCWDSYRLGWEVWSEGGMCQDFTVHIDMVDWRRQASDPRWYPEVHCEESIEDACSIYESPPWNRLDPYHCSNNTPHQPACFYCP